MRHPLEVQVLTDVSIHLLGDFGVEHQGKVVPIRQGSRRVVAFLSLQRHPVPRSVVAEVLWPERTAEQASANLRAALSRLPRPAGRAMTSTVDAQLSLSEYAEVDLHRSDAKIRHLRTDVPVDPAGTRVGDVDPLPMLDHDVLPLWDDDWLLVERERFRQARLHALERLSTSLRLVGRWDDALQAALAAVAGEPLRESGYRSVIEVHLAEGNHAEALRQYETYRRVLGVELGLRPSESMQQLVHELLRSCDHLRPGV